MKICSTFENKKFEKRIAITPEIAKKYINLGLEVSLIENYGKNINEAVRKRDQIAVESFKYMQEKTKSLSF